MYTIFGPQPALGVDYGAPLKMCPPGEIGFEPACVKDPTYVEPTTPPASPPVDPSMPTLPSSSCPEGEFGIPPLCEPLPGGGTTPETPSCPGGEVWAPGLNKCIPYEGGVEEEPVPNGEPEPAEDLPLTFPAPTWWDQLTTAEKGFVVGGSALAGYLIVRLVAAPRAYQPNYCKNTNKARRRGR